MPLISIFLATPSHAPSARGTGSLSYTCSTIEITGDSSETVLLYTYNVVYSQPGKLPEMMIGVNNEGIHIDHMNC